MDFKVILATLAILISSFFEQFVITGTVRSFFSYRPHFAYEIVSLLTIVLSGYVIDSNIGRFHGIWISFTLSAIGAGVLSLFSYELHLSNVIGYVVLIAGLGLVLLGSSGIRCSLSPFGAQQVDRLGSTAVQSFFNWYYWFMILGSCGCLLISNRNIWFLVFGYRNPLSFQLALTLLLCLALIIFLIPTRFYLKEQPKAEFFTIVSHALHRRRIARNHNITWLDHARVSYGGIFSNDSVNEIVRFGRMIPVFTVFLLYSIINYAAGITLVRSITQLDYQSLTSLFPYFGILIVIPILNLVIYPLLKLCTGHDIKYFIRIGLGIFLAVILFINFGVFDVAKSNRWIECSQRFRNDTCQSVYVILYEISQSLLFGLTAVLTWVTGLEFAYTEAPLRMKSITMGLFLSLNFCGFFAYEGLMLILELVNRMLRQNIQRFIMDGLYPYCFFGAGLAAANFLLLICLAFWYNRKKEEDAMKSTIPAVIPALKHDEIRDINSDDIQAPLHKIDIE